MTIPPNDSREPAIEELLTARRELTEFERERLQRYSAAAWETVSATIAARAHDTYMVASAQDFRECIGEHMTLVEQFDMVGADVFHCVVCGRLLKDRRTPLASSILLERRRLAAMLTEVEQAPRGSRERARLWLVFRAGLGL